MTNKEVLRRGCLVFGEVCFIYVSVKFALGKASTFETMLMATCDFVLVLNLITSIISKIVEIVNSYSLYKSYRKRLEYLENLHKIRYKLYFTGSKEEVEEYSTKIENYGTILLKGGKEAISKKLLRKKHSQKVQEILKQTEKLMTTVR